MAGTGRSQHTGKHSREHSPKPRILSHKEQQGWNVTAQSLALPVPSREVQRWEPEVRPQS